MNPTKQYGGFDPINSTIRSSIFMRDVDTTLENQVAGPSRIPQPDELWSPQRMADISSAFNVEQQEESRAPPGTPPFAYASFGGKRGNFDWTPGRERAVGMQISPMDRPSSVGPYGLAGRSFRNDRLEPSPTIRRARSQYHSTSNSRATSPIPIPATTPPFRARPMIGEDGRNEFLIGDVPRRRSNSADLGDIGQILSTSGHERRQVFGRRSVTADTAMSTSAGTESSVRAGKQKLQEGRPPGPRLPPQLRATLMAEKDLPGQEMRSEALLQRFILSNPTSLPVTPRMPRGSRGRMFSSFSRVNSDSSPSPSQDSSDDDGPFGVDEALESDDGSRRAMVGLNQWDPSRMEVDMLQFGGSGLGEGSIASTSDAGSGMNIDGPSAVRRTPFAKPSINGLNGFGHMAVDEMTGGMAGSGLPGSPRGDVVPSMLWRESPSSHGRVSKRKAIAEDTRFEPYSKRPRAGAETSNSSGSGHSHNHSPYHSNSPNVNPISISPSSTEVMDIGGGGGGSSNGNNSGQGQGRVIAYARSRAGSPSAASVSLAMRAISPVASSPLSNGLGQYNQNRPIIGMGGLGMLLLSKRNANAMSVGMGLMADGDGESSAVAEGIEGMDVAADGGDEDESMAD